MHSNCHIVKKILQCKNSVPPPGQAYQPTNAEHIANIVTHGLALPPSFLILWSLHYDLKLDYTRQLACLYSAAVILLFSTSATFHIVAFLGKFPRLHYFLHLGDRSVIYLFIASSYTPWVCLREFDLLYEHHCLSLIWSAAFTGILLQFAFHEKYKLFLIFLYVAVSLLPAVFFALYIKDMTGIFEMALGGLFYLIGLIIFKLDGRLPFAHAIWHLFVVAGCWIQVYFVTIHVLQRYENEKMSPS